MTNPESQSKQQPVSSQGNSEGGARRRKKQRFLRWVMRRKQCRWMLGINLIIMATLIAIFCGMHFGTQTHFEELRRLKQESRVLKRVVKNITFVHCKFVNEDPTKVAFSAELCGSETVDYAKVFRFHYKSPSQPSCASLYEEAPCHEWLESERKKPENATRVPKRLKKIDHCRGLLGVPMPNDSYVSTDQGVEIIAPAVENADNLVELMDTVVLASELVVKCPRCKVLTRDFRLRDPYLPQIEAASEDDYKDAQVDEQCKWFPRMLDTEIYGWPAVAEKCDRFEVYRLTMGTKQTECCARECSPGFTPEPDLTTPWQNHVLQGEDTGAVNSTVTSSTAL